MTVDEQLANIDTTRLYQPFVAKLRAALAGAAAAGVAPKAVRGLVSYDEQIDLYLQGRQTPGFAVGRPGVPALGLVVTTERPGASPSQFGITVEFDCRDDEWPTLVSSAREYGLTPRDGKRLALDTAPHGLLDRNMSVVYSDAHSEADAIRAVHALLDTRAPW